MQNSTVIKAEKVNKSFKVAGGVVQVLKDVSFEILPNEFAVIYGPSGSGKSTILHTILGLEKPDGGKVSVLGKDLYENYHEDDVAEFRKKHVGMVYQQSNWVKSLNVIENVAFPLALQGESRYSRMEKAKQLLTQVGMVDWAYYHPAQLSSGQQQKVSLCRALINDPEIIIADEPTGNLDFNSGNVLMDLLKNINQRYQKTIVMVTHDLEYLDHADKAIEIRDGQVINIINPKTLISQGQPYTTNSKKTWPPSQTK